MLKNLTTLREDPRFKNFFLLIKQFKKNKGAVIGFYIILIFIILGLFAPIIATHNPLEQNLNNTLAPLFTNGHLLGSDDLGRDTFSRIIYGARLSMMIGIISVGIALFIGIIIGLLTGYYGGIFDVIVMRFIDILLAFPYVLLTIVVVSVLGPSLINAMIAIGVSNFPSYIRIVRSSVLAEKKEDYVMADVAAGASDSYIMFRSILPNSLTPIFVQATMGIGGAILSAAALSFLGMGAQPPTPEWGLMIANGKSFISLAPRMIFIPGIAVLFVVVGFNLFADGIRDIMDPKLKE